MPRTWFRKFLGDDGDGGSTTFRVHSYRYRCSKWYGWVEGTRTVALDTNTSTTEPSTTEALQKDAQNATLSDNCSVTLLQVYNMTVGKIQPFAALGLGVQTPICVPKPAENLNKK